jgi:hypothetical protein
LSSRPLDVPPIAFAIVNRAPESVSNVTVTVDPLSRERDGALADGKLLLSQDTGSASASAGTVTAQFDSKVIAAVRLSARGRLSPGRYVSHLYVSSPDIDKPLEIPVTVDVAAHAAWPVGCLVLGLASLGLIGLFGGAATVREKQAEILALRQSFHEFLERSPPCESDRAHVAEVEDQLTQALKALSQPRPWELKDRRLTIAERARETAEKRIEALRVKMDKTDAAVDEVRDVERQWARLVRHVRSVQKQLSDRQMALERSKGLAAKLAVALQRLRETLLERPLSGIDAELGPHVRRAGLLLASAQTSEAQTYAVHVRRWVRRAARLLEDRIRQLLGWHSFVQEMAAQETSLESDCRAPDLPDEARTELRKQLDNAHAALDPVPSPPAVKACHGALQQAATFALKARSQALLEAVETAMRAAAAETSLEAVSEALAGLAPGDPPEIKQRNLLGILDLLGTRIDACQDDGLRVAFHESIHQMREFVESGDLEKTGTPFQALLARWDEYEQVHVNRARRTVVNPFCARLSAALREELQVSAERLRLVQPHHSLVDLDEELDAIRSRLERVSEDECLAELTDLFQRVLIAGDRMFTTLLSIAEVTPEVRLAAAESSEVQAAIELARRLMAEPRELRVVARSPDEEQYEYRQVSIEIGDLDPSWGAGVTVAIDWDDDTRLVRKTAEEIRQDPVLTHRYEQPRPACVSVVAEESVPGQGSGPPGETLGQGQFTLDIKPSPISKARELAGVFLNLRFVTALAIGLVVETWRLYGDQPFGMQIQDYVEAFALGVGIDSGMRGLTSLLR